MFEKPSKQRAIILGGFAIGLVSGIPGLNLINCCCCAGILFGGALTYYLHIQDYKLLTPPDNEQYRVWIGSMPVDARLAPEASDALILGLLAGIVGAILATMISAIILLAVGPVEQEMVQRWMMKFLEKLEQRGSIPSESIDQIREQFEKSAKEGFSMNSIMFGFIANLIIYPIFGMLGGLLGHGLFGRQRTIPNVPH